MVLKEPGQVWRVRVFSEEVSLKLISEQNVETYKRRSGRITFKTEQHEARKDTILQSS